MGLPSDFQGTRISIKQGAEPPIVFTLFISLRNKDI